jgi:hypothetical protein
MGMTKSKSLTSRHDDVTAPRNLQMKLQSIDLLRIGSCECVEKVQRIKAKLRVPAPLVFGHRNHAGGVSERWCVQVIGVEAATERVGGDEMHGKVQELTTEP